MSIIRVIIQRNHQRTVKMAIIQRNGQKGQYCQGKGLPRLDPFQGQRLATCTVF